MRGAWRKQRLHSRPKFVGQSETIIRHARCRAHLGLLHAQEMGTASQMSTVPFLSGYALSASVFTATGFRNACTIGLISGNRNVTLAWAAAGGTLSMFTEAYVAACVIPILSLPLIIK